MNSPTAVSTLVSATTPITGSTALPAISGMIVSPPPGTSLAPISGAALIPADYTNGGVIISPAPLQMSSNLAPALGGLVRSTVAPSHPVNPATNDAPLEFNTNKNKPPMPVTPNGMVEDEVQAIDPPLSNNDRHDKERNSHERTKNRPHSRDKEREKETRSRVRDRGRDRDREKDRERPRDRGDRDREKGRMRIERQRKEMEPISHTTTTVDTTSNVIGAPPQPAHQSVEAQANQSFMGGPWGPVWGPMTPMGPIGGPMGGPVGPMGPHMGPMGPMPPGPMGGPGEVPPLSGDFRINWGMFNWMMSPEGLTVPIKNPLHCKMCVLVPPNRLAPPPTTRERPPGCRTVFVGGLPENATEEIVRDVFERCGEITTIRLSKKNFCHIRYELEEYVDNAIFLSGYRMRIDNSTDAANTGRLHVDYAQARDDQYEYECRQRQLLREQRHRERLEAERLRPPSPPPVVHYSEHESSVISDQLKADNSFSKAAQILITWLERGDCNKRNAGVFYSMIQSTNSHVRRLMTEKGQYEEELAKFREQTRARMQGIVMQFGQIERVFAASSHQKVWDHFTKAQRRNIEMWKKQAQEIKSIQLDESDKDDTEEMDVSDDENSGFSLPPVKKRKTSNDALKEENDSLRCQLEAYKNEVDLIKADLSSEISIRDDQIDGLRKALNGMQQTLAENATRRKQDEASISELTAKLKKIKDTDAELGEDNDAAETEEAHSTGAAGPITEKTAWLIGLTSTFLHIHPKGASVDYIWSYIQQFDKDIRPIDIENTLNQFPPVYRQITTGVGACMERKWTFTGFNEDKDTAAASARTQDS